MAFTSRIPAVSVPTESSYNGSPTIVLPNPDDPSKPGKSMGVAKLRAVFANLDACRAFVAKHHKAKENPAAEARVQAAETKSAKLTALLSKLGGLSKEQIEASLASA
jgi:hypothetical protein